MTNNWQKIRLGQYIEIKHGYAFKSEYFAPNGSYILMTPGNFFEEGGFKSRGDKEKYYIGDFPSDYLLQKGDLLIAMTEQAPGLLGSSAIIPEDKRYLHNQRLGLINNWDETELDIGFLYYLFSSRNVRKQIHATASGTKVKHTSPSRIYSLQILLPPLPEQRKIAAFLGAVDAKLDALRRKRALLAENKRGVMQKLFSQQIRFTHDDGTPFPDWEELELGAICSITTGKLDANAMVDNGEYRFYTCAREYYRIDNYAFNSEALLISGNGANVGYIHYYKGKFNAYQRTYVLENFSEYIRLIKFALDVNLPRRIHRERKEGNTPYIVMGTLTGLKLKLPITLQEQVKIAAFLTAIDNKITAVDQQISQIETFKKGLLQQMFV